MGIRLHCDRCQRFIRVVPSKNIREITEKESVCKLCEKAELAMKAQLDKLKRKAQADFEKMANLYKELLSEAIRKAVEDGNPDNHEGHQDLRDGSGAGPE